MDKRKIVYVTERDLEYENIDTCNPKDFTSDIAPVYRAVILKNNSSLVSTIQYLKNNSSEDVYLKPILIFGDTELNEEIKAITYGFIKNEQLSKVITRLNGKINKILVDTIKT